jgi:hypothetical protein
MNGNLKYEFILRIYGVGRMVLMLRKNSDLIISRFSLKTSPLNWSFCLATSIETPTC